jgi:hypothetical protein
MAKTPDNNNANAGRQTGKSAGRPVRVSSVKKEEKQAAGKKRSRPAKPKPPKVPKPLANHRPNLLYEYRQEQD